MTHTRCSTLPIEPATSQSLDLSWPIDDDHQLEIKANGRTSDDRIRWSYRLLRHGNTIFKDAEFRSGTSTQLTVKESLRAARGLLTFLTLQPGDVEPEYFENYTPAQLDWRDSYAEELAAYALERCCGYCSDHHDSPTCSEYSRVVIRATILYDSETYIQHSVSETGLTDSQWADKFTALGGEICNIRPSWRDVNCPTGKVAVHATGTPRAVDYVQACCMATRP
jgi:hypothetical protein